jgi:hypothetical protein
MERVRRADPIGDIDVRQWSSSDDARRRFDLIVGNAVIAQQSPRRRKARWIGGAVVVTGAALATAAAASGILGEPAPDPIRAHIAAVDDGLPDDLRVNPDVANAMAVASTAAGVLYAADLKAGGYCLEVASEHDRPRGAVCVTAGELGDRAIEVTAPIPAGPDDALLVGGRINDARIDRLVARYPNGISEDVALGLAKYWLLEVPDAARAAALSNGLEIAGVSADGVDIAVIDVPPLLDDDPTGTAHDHSQPIFVSTISDGRDLTLVLGVEGSVNVAGASTLELQYPDGSVTPIAMAADGSYRLALPAVRQADFATAWGQLVARDTNGSVVASTTFSSVANTRRHS